MPSSGLLLSEYLCIYDVSKTPSDFMISNTVHFRKFQNQIPNTQSDQIFYYILIYSS